MMKLTSAYELGFNHGYYNCTRPMLPSVQKQYDEQEEFQEDYDLGYYDGCIGKQQYA